MLPTAARLLIHLAYRNLLGHPRRSLLTILAIAAGLAALIFLWAFNDGLHRNMRDNFQDSLVGSLQVHRAGFFQRPKLAAHIADDAPIISALRQAGVSRWTRRLETFALAASQRATEGSFLIAVDPARERRVTRLHQKVSRGRFIRPGDRYTCVMGATTARNLGLEIGDEAVLVSHDRFGILSAERFRLVGIIASGELGLDRGLVLVPLESLQEMLEMRGRVTDIPVKLASGELAAVAGQLRRALAAEDLEILRWDEMFPVLSEWIALHNGFLYLFLGIVVLIVLAGVLNTVLLSMLERVREFGLLMALGHRGAGIGYLVLAETLMLSLAGLLVGLLCGLALVALSAHIGIDLSAVVGATERFYVDPLIRPVVDLAHLGQTVAALLGVSLLSGLYPAWRATRLMPAEALRHV